MKLNEWAKKQGIQYRTAWNMFKSGKIKNAYKLPTGTIIVPESVINKKDYVVCYSRVSSSENKTNLESQAKRVVDFCLANGWIVSEIIKEVGSGLNDKRPKLLKCLRERKATKIVVEHSDRLTRFGFNYIKELYPECEILVINKSETDEKDLMQDFVSLVTSFCARLYGHRRSKRATEKIIKELKND